MLHKNYNMTAAIDKKIQDALSKMNNKQKKAVLGLVTAFSEEEVYDHWKDKEFVAEMDRRADEYFSGKAKLYSLDEVEKEARVGAEKMRTKKAS